MTGDVTDDQGGAGADDGAGAPLGPGAVALGLAPPHDPAAEPGIPPGLARVSAFVNTREISGSATIEGFASPADLGAWLVAQDLMEADVCVDETDLREAIRIREALREGLFGHAGHEVEPWAVAELGDAGRRAPVAVTFSPDGAPSLEPTGTGVRAAFGRMFADIAVAVADGTWPRLKACRNDECRWAYFDASRNRSGRWCSMASCGNRMKGRAYRDRVRSASDDEHWTE
jgi:predicted RNA-binding Zn ribbon-like protein